MIDNLPMKKMDTQTQIFLFVIQPIALPIVALRNGQTEVFEKASCQRDFNNFLYQATQALTQEEKDVFVRNFADRYESCEKYYQKNK